MLLGLILVFLIVIMLLVLVTQVVLPFKKNTPLFPALRAKDPLAGAVLEAENELVRETELAELQQQLHELKRQKAELKKESDTQNGNS